MILDLQTTPLLPLSVMVKRKTRGKKTDSLNCIVGIVVFREYT